MKILKPASFYLLCGLLAVIFLIGGCGEPSVSVYSYRSSVELGMTMPQAWLAANEPHYELISESVEKGCKEELYRFWFNRPEAQQDFNIGNLVKAAHKAAYSVYYSDDSDKYDPYLLTFRDCTIADDDATNAERKRRADAWLAKKPDLAKETEKLCQEQGISPSNKATLVELIEPGLFSDLPRSGLDSLLIRIDYDAEMVAGNQNQQNQDQYLGHLRRMEQLKQQEIQNQQFDSMRNNMPIHVRPDGAGGYIINQ